MPKQYSPPFSRLNMHIEPQTARFQIKPSADGLHAIIPARRHIFIMLFITVWLGGWIMGEVSVIGQLLHSREQTPTAFLTFWLAGWTLGGAFAIGAVLWQLAGKEIIVVNAATLSYRIEILGMGYTRNYRASDVKDLRATEFSANIFTNQRAWFPPIVGSGFGPIAFDYGARTIRLTPSLEEAEAKMLVQKLSSRLPHH